MKLWKVVEEEPYCTGGLSRTRVYAVLARTEEEAFRLSGKTIVTGGVKWSATIVEDRIVRMGDFPTAKPAKTLILS
jgi:hypothetical protein